MAQACVSNSVEQILAPPTIKQSDEEDIRGSILQDNEGRDAAEEEDIVDNCILEEVNYDSCTLQTN